jgi:hypothetical protein
MDCRGGNDADIEACEIAYAAQEDVAAVYGCEDRWEDYVICLEDQYRCSNRDWTHDGDCNNRRDSYNDCAR